MGEIVELVELEWGWSPQAVVVVLARCVALLDCLFVCLFATDEVQEQGEK